MLAPALGVAVAIFREGRLLLGRRIAAHGNGLYQLPGGKPRRNEALRATAIREVDEETGLHIADAHELARQVDDFPEIGKRYSTVFYGAHAAAGEPVNREPAKCEGWAWYSMDGLPRDLFAIDASTLAAIRHFGESL